MNLPTNTPIRTLMLNEFKNNVVPVIGDTSDVYIDPPRWLQEGKVQPYTSIFTFLEKVKKINLLAEKELNIEIFTFVNVSTSDDARTDAALIDAAIQIQILKQGSSILQYAQYVELQPENCFDTL
ncbi:MAG: hypothetical protein WB290_17350, partial [Smithella sp.]